ncbi:MAG: glycogen debranching enzyme family protein [Anaerolineae bacterium]|nr:glycogen debranching enzyme family protein [Anaerolineae bacterium]
MIHFGREVTGTLDSLLRREWLVTNGIGGYAMGSLAGARTRRYHSLLTASLQPPTRRTLMVATLDAWVEIDGRRSPLVTHEWAAGVVLPDGYRHLESFHLDGTIPVFVWALGDVRIVQRIWMAHGHNTTYVTYTLTRGTAGARLVIKPLCTYRDHHQLTKGGYPVDVTTDDSPWEDGLAITVHAQPGRGTMTTQPFRILCNQGTVYPNPEWWWSFHLAQEKQRGLENQEDLFSAASIEADLDLGDSLALAFTTEDDTPAPWKSAFRAERDRQRALTDQAALGTAPDWIQQLALAADQFIVRREIRGEQGQSIIAGYPWFSDWGRDCMIALPGLTLATGRIDTAATILHTFAQFIDRGMLPNRFPDAGQAPDYNTVDATLWYFQSIYACYKSRGSAIPVLMDELYPVMVDILEWHIKGTRYNIRRDPADGLLFAGEPGLQLTWMDAKIDDWVVTPRVGKPVEINALWYNALRIVAEIAATRGEIDDAQRFNNMAEQVHTSFNARFWYSAGYLYDVVDGPDGDDPTLRPNQIFAISLPFGLLDKDKARAIVDICARELVTSYGLRSLAPDETDYTGYYGGDPLQRDSAYHQGTAWSWLIGPFVCAHYKIYQDAQTAYSYLEPLADHLNDHGLGTISEIFDGDPSHTPRGCSAQAWSVAEVLRAWRVLESALAQPGRHPITNT